MKTIDFSKPLLELATQYPEVKELMAQLGFAAIKTPGMLQTAGRYMTIPKGAKMKKIPIEKVTESFEAAGFTVINNNQ